MVEEGRNILQMSFIRKCEIERLKLLCRSFYGWGREGYEAGVEDGI